MSNFADRWAQMVARKRAGCWPSPSEIAEARWARAIYPDHGVVISPWWGMQLPVPWVDAARLGYLSVQQWDPRGPWPTGYGPCYISVLGVDAIPLSGARHRFGRAWLDGLVQSLPAESPFRAELVAGLAETPEAPVSVQVPYSGEEGEADHAHRSQYAGLRW